jgi:hypothetical protein
LWPQARRLSPNECPFRSGPSRHPRRSSLMILAPSRYWIYRSDRAAHSIGRKSISSYGRGRRAMRVVALLTILPSARRMRKRRTFSRAKSIIVPKTCSASWTRSRTKSPPVTPKISLGVSQNASRRFQPIRTFRSERMEGGADRGPGSCPTRALRRSHWVSYPPCRAQATPKRRSRPSHWACTPRAVYQCRGEPGASRQRIARITQRHHGRHGEAAA